MIAILIIFFLPQAEGLVGFGPAEVSTSNQRDTLVIGKVTLVNGDDVAQYGVFSIFIPSTNLDTFQPVPSEMTHLRVICHDCGEEMQRYEAIEGYVYPDSPLEGTCTECGSHNLVFYEPIPRDEIHYLSLEGAENFVLVKENDVYMTTVMIAPHGACNVNVLYDASESYIKENEGKHWEAHLRGTAQLEEEAPFGVVGGIDLRILISFKFPLFIDVPKNLEKGKEFTVRVVYGDIKRTWEKVPSNVHVSFNGILKPIDAKGYVTFLMPDTRLDYEYSMEAKGETYLSIVKIVSPGGPNEDEAGWLSLQYILIIAAVIAVIVIAVVVVIWRRKPKKSW